VELIFYSLEVDLNPNYKNILSLLEKKKPDFFLHVHYFGRVSSQEMTRDLCNTYNMLMIEDCAHIIHPSVANQWFGDYLFFSPHKFFPVKNGGVLYSKEAMKNNNNHVRSFFPFFWYLKKYFSLIKYKNNINCNIQWNSKSEKFNFFLPSSAEINLIKASSRNLKEISKIRVLNKDKLLAVFSRKSDLRQLVIYDSSDVPYIVGVKCDDISFAKNLCTSLRKLNCPVMKWPDLPNEILKIECQNDINLIKSSIFFFIHEQIDINKYTKIISQAINEY